MWRKFHLWFGLSASLLIILLAVTGTVLATKPMYNAYHFNTEMHNLSAADIIQRIYRANKRIEPQKLVIHPSGKTKFTYSKRGKTRKKLLSLHTGKLKRIPKEPKTYAFMRKLHRSMLIGQPGRIFPAIGGIAMLTLMVSGLIILIRRAGGIVALFRSMSWNGIANQHSALGRLLIVPLLLLSLTSVWLSGVTYSIVPAGSGKPPAYPETLQELAPVDPWKLKGLQTIPASDINEIIFPLATDWFDVWTIKTANEYIFIDQFSGDILKRESISGFERLMDWVTVLHTGKGNIIWATILMLSALSIPFFAITGTLMWWRSRTLRGGRIKQQTSASAATTVILVGSESGSTWGIAKALHTALSNAGDNVRTIEMNALAKSYPKAQRLLVLVATYGDGEAPQSAKKFLKKLTDFSSTSCTFATLAFGDQAFPKFCAYGKEVNTALRDKGLAELMDITEVDKRSSHTLDTWCRNLNERIRPYLSSDLQFDYQEKRPKTHTLQVASVQQFGEQLGVPMSILCFSGRIPQHHPGDWLAIYAPDCNIARLYSLGSSSKYDKKVEICVRLQEGGVCSPWLCSLSQGDEIDARIIHNTHFHLPKKKPIIMIAAGTGMAPFVGMIRHNTQGQNINLFWGGRHPDVDGIYGEEIAEWLDAGKLNNFFPAWSRNGPKMYVQDSIMHQQAIIKESIADGAVVMICGGRTMANAVEAVIENIIADMGLSVSHLKDSGRYLEDVY